MKGLILMKKKINKDFTGFLYAKDTLENSIDKLNDFFEANKINLKFSFREDMNAVQVTYRR